MNALLRVCRRGNGEAEITFTDGAAAMVCILDVVTAQSLHRLLQGSWKIKEKKKKKGKKRMEDALK